MNDKRSPTVPATAESSIEDLIRRHAPNVIKDKEHLDYAITEGIAAIAEAARKVIAFNPNNNISPEEAAKKALENEKKTGKRKMYFDKYTNYMKRLGKTGREIYDPALDGESVFQNMGLIASRWSVLKSKGFMVGTPVIYRGKEYTIIDLTKDCRPRLKNISEEKETPFAINPGDFMKLKKMEVKKEKKKKK